MCRKVDAQRLVCVRYIHRTLLFARNTRAEAYTGRGEVRKDKPPASRGSAPYEPRSSTTAARSAEGEEADREARGGGGERRWDAERSEGSGGATNEI